VCTGTLCFLYTVETAGNFFSLRYQEAAESITFGRHVSNRSKFIYSESWRQELSIAIYMSQIGVVGEGVGGSGGIQSLFWTPPP
jgi:hypothetical protein